MAKLTKATLTQAIQDRTGLSRRKAQKALQRTLETLKIILKRSKQVDLGKAGRLVVVKREQQRVIRKNLKGRYPTSIVELHKKHPSSVRLLAAKDLSENPKPSVVYKKPAPEPVPAKRSFAIAIPRFRGRPAR